MASFSVFARRLSSTRFGINSLINLPASSLIIRTNNQSVKYYSTSMEEAKKRISLMTEDPGNMVKLKMYALYKQATVGACNTKKPGVFDFVGQAKWNSWNELGTLSKEDAEKQYIELVDSLAGPAESPVSTPTEEVEATVIDGLDITHENGVCTIKLNRPKKLNAITGEMYDGIMDALNKTANDDSIRLVVLTGEGKFFSSGNDLKNFTNIPPEGPKKMAADGRKRLKVFVESFINYPKPIVSAVNGPAIGIMVTILALTDLIYATESATFQTPFMSLGQCPEGCSSYTFPKIMGYAQANEILLGGRKLTAQEAFARGFVTDVFPDSEFHQVVTDKVKYLATLPPKSIIYCKRLNRDREKDMLLKVNEEECIRLEERWLSEECMNAVMAFLARNSKM